MVPSKTLLKLLFCAMLLSPSFCIELAAQESNSSGAKDAASAPHAPLDAAQTAPPASSLPPPAPIPTGQLRLSALYQHSNQAIRSGLTWRIFSTDANNPLQIISSEEPAPTFTLSTGEYVVHLSSGFATATRRVNITPAGALERVSLPVGGLVVRGKFIDGKPIPEKRQQISVFIPQQNDSEGKLVTRDLRADQVLRLPEGVYHVVSTYAGSNSSARADVRVQIGKVIEMSMVHRAATTTMKLVREAGGAAYANVTWSLQTPGGDFIRDATGAFPSLELAEGEYIVIARLERNPDEDPIEYKGKMKVDAGVNRDFELVAD